MKKSSSKEQLHTNTELRRYLGALHEEHMGAIKAMGEQFVDVNRKLDGIDQKLDSHTEMIGKLAVDVEVIKSDISIIKNDLKQKIDRDEFVLLERRVLRLEAKSR